MTKRHSKMGQFFLRWFISSLGIWVAAGLIGDNIDYQSKFRVIVFSGLVLSIVNMYIRPLVVLLSLPAILLSFGLFMIVINGLMVVIASWLYSPLNITNFWAAMLAGMIIGLVNYLVITILEERRP